jgi:phospholipid-binding lipoprotein MlaA
MYRLRLVLKVTTSLCFVLLLTGCAKNPSYPQDPYEKFNRAMFKFDMGVDHVVYRPISKVYMTITPPPLQRGISNVFTNVGTLTTIPNDILQGKIKYTLLDTWRFIINSTVGVGGLFDVASHLGFPKHYEDFGMTLAYYSDKKPSPYLVLPFVGPMTLRETIAQPVDYLTAPWPYVRPTSLSYSLAGLKWINLRAQAMPANKLIDSSFDPYAFMRSAFLQKRNELIRHNRHDYISSYHAPHRPVSTRNSAQYR